jgi:hypothetical protein
MERRPVQYGPRQLVGYEALRDWTPIRDDAYATLGLAQADCSRMAGETLDWEPSVKSPEGHQYYKATSRKGAPYNWQTGPNYENTHQPIPDAEFVSPDPRCNIYIKPNGDRWLVMNQIDLEGHDRTYLAFKGLGWDANRLHHFQECAAENRETALRYGRYVWARSLIQQLDPPTESSRFRRLLQRWARRLL